MTGGRRMAAIFGFALAWVSNEAAADALPFDDEAYSEAKTSIEVHGVAALGDVVLVVYPYPCMAWGEFESFEDRLRLDPGAQLEPRWGDEEEVKGYLVVPDGERFESTTNWEGPLANCHFYGLPRSEFPAEGGAIARLDAMSQTERWRLFSRHPSVLRTGVALAMDAVVKASTQTSRVVTYEARRDGPKLVIEAVRWTWGSGRVQDPRKPSRKDVAVLEPYDDRDEEVEERYFAGSLVGVPWPAASPTGEPADPPAEAANPPAEPVTPTTGAPATAPESTPAQTQGSAAVAASAPAQTSAPASAAKIEATPIPPALLYGGGCLLVAAATGMMLRRGRR